MDLIDRLSERRVLDGVLRDVRAGHSRVLLLHGEAGVGKSALMEYVAQRAVGCRLFRATGVESEMELAYAALHQLCVPVLDRLDRLPAPQREALSVAFGLSAGPVPDRFLMGLALLSLFSDVAEDQPLVCLVDDLPISFGLRGFGRGLRSEVGTEAADSTSHRPPPRGVGGSLHRGLCGGSAHSAACRQRRARRISVGW